MNILGDITKVLQVTEAKLSGLDVLIGMDVIGDGDFAISHNHKTNDTILSYRTPSVGKIDFVEQAKANRSERRKNSKKNKTERQNRKKARRNK